MITNLIVWVAFIERKSAENHVATHFRLHKSSHFGRKSAVISTEVSGALDKEVSGLDFGFEGCMVITAIWKKIC